MVLSKKFESSFFVKALDESIVVTGSNARRNEDTKKKGATRLSLLLRMVVL